MAKEMWGGSTRRAARKQLAVCSEPEEAHVGGADGAQWREGGKVVKFQG